MSASERLEALCALELTLTTSVGRRSYLALAVNASGFQKGVMTLVFLFRLKSLDDFGLLFKTRQSGRYQNSETREYRFTGEGDVI